MKFAIFGLSASVDIKPLPGAWVVELLGGVLALATPGFFGLVIPRGGGGGGGAHWSPPANFL